MSSAISPEFEQRVLVPRRYQEEVFSRAMQGNIVAALDTGSGKTLISLLLIKWISAQGASRDKVIIFLVPKVVLVEQQANFIDKNTSLRVKRLHGSLDIDLTDRTWWKELFDNHDVFVMTAQIFLNVLTHSLWSIDRVSLMIFDECHHARKDHPYNGILREYFETKPSSRRPKIFGMTASPIWDPKDAVGSLAALEANMDCKVIGVRDHIEELASHSPKPLEVIQQYSKPPNTYDFPYPTIYQCFSVFDSTVWDQLDIPWTTVEMRYIYTLTNLGPYCASLFLYQEIQHHLSAFLHEHRSTISNNGYLDMESNTINPSVEALEQILLDFEPFFSSSSVELPISVPLNWCTPKIKALVDVLLSFKSSSFQGIIFVEQRQVASCLSKLLPSVPELKGTIRCAHLVGQGVNSEGVSKGTDVGRKDAVKLFREGKINILIATSVAEEGLDFPACDLVVRFDPLQHMVGYVQSRGRARNKASTFVVMVPNDDIVQIERFKALQQGEPEVSRVYQAHDLDNLAKMDEDELEGDIKSEETERYVVPSTGAVLTYDNSINLLNHLCATIHRDEYTPIHAPQFTGDFEVTLRLPSTLPLPSEALNFTGPFKRSKKEAKRAAAFCAVKRLHELHVFDDFLLPSTSGKNNLREDAEGKPLIEVRELPSVLTTLVRYPWTMGPKLWMHTVFLNNQAVVGLVTGTSLSPLQGFECGGVVVRTAPSKLLTFDESEEHERRKAMEDFTKLGIWYRITGSPISSPISVYLVPVTKDEQPDYQAMADLLENPYGRSDWDLIRENSYDRLLVMNTNEFGRILLLKNIRHDMSPMSTPPPGYLNFEGQFATYRDAWVKKWTRKKGVPIIPEDGPLLETVIFPRRGCGLYPLAKLGEVENTVPTNILLSPQGCCRWIPISPSIYSAFEAFPSICLRMTDLYRARCAKFELGLPPISEDLLIESLTLPCAGARYSNQRMETLGDAVLELCTTVHLLNKYPSKHEGQLSKLRQLSVSNNYLLSRAREVDLERYLISEAQTTNKWQYTLPPPPSDDSSLRHIRLVARSFPRRSLQDCMEAILGASFITGGIEMALQSGSALGLTFGGAEPWSLRYHKDPSSYSPPSRSFSELIIQLGYAFKDNSLLLEALTHPSFGISSECPSYQRLEFLGDALLDLVVAKYLYDKFPDATSHQLAFPRTKSICAPALAFLAVKKLGLQKVVLVNNVDLNIAIDRHVPILEALSGEEIVKRGWSYDPPKVLSDIFESVMGAVLVDSGYDYDIASVIVESMMDEVLAALSPSMDKDPVSELVQWAAGAGCTQIKNMPGGRPQGHLALALNSGGITVKVHDILISGPIISSAGTSTVAKFEAAEIALSILKDESSDKCLSRICLCRKANAVSILVEQVHIDDDHKSPDSDLNDMDEVEALLIKSYA